MDRFEIIYTASVYCAPAVDRLFGEHGIGKPIMRMRMSCSECDWMVESRDFDEATRSAEVHEACRHQGGAT